MWMEQKYLFISVLIFLISYVFCVCNDSAYLYYSLAMFISSTSVSVFIIIKVNDQNSSLFSFLKKLTNVITLLFPEKTEKRLELEASRRTKVKLRTTSLSDTTTTVSCLEKASLHPEILEEINLLMKFVLKDFVRNWYENISEDEEFVRYLTQLLEEAIVLLCRKLKNLNKLLVINQIISVYTCYLSVYLEWLSSKSYKTWKNNGKSIVNTFSQFESYRKYDENYLKMKTSLLVKSLCPSQELRSCKLFSYFGFVDIIHHNLMLPLISTASDSDWLYETITLLLSSDIKISDSIDFTKILKNSSSNYEDASIESDVYEYENDLRQRSSSLPSLALLKNLYDDRFFNQILSQLSCDESSKLGYQPGSSLPDVNKLKSYAAVFNENYSSSEDIGEDTGVMFAISSQENLSQFQENAESIRLVFTDVNIPATEQHKSSGINPSFTVYCIRYLAWYMVPCSSETEDNDGYFIIDDMKYVQKQTVVRRRFREFVNLQTRLESNQNLKKCLKGIKGPNKYLNSPFSNMAKHTVEQRRILLERYLISLCKTEEICTSSVLREFMAYGTNAHIAFVNKPREMLRLDKIVLRSVSDVFSKIRTVLPSIDGYKENPNDLTFKKSRSLPFLSQNMPQIDSFDYSVIHSYSHEPTSSFSKSICKFLHSLKSKECDRLEDNLRSESYSNFSPPDSKESTISSSILDLAKLLFDNKDIPENVVTLMKTLFGDYINSYIVKSVDELTAEDSIKIYLQYARESFWPGGIFYEHCQATKNIEEKEATKLLAIDAVKKFFPQFWPKVIGEEQYDKCAKVFINSLNHEELNRVLLHLIFDVLIDAILSTSEEYEEV